MGIKKKAILAGKRNKREVGICGGEEVRIENPQRPAKTHHTMSSQAVEPLPHLGPEGGQVARRNEETTFPNYPETVWG